MKTKDAELLARLLSERSETAAAPREVRRSEKIGSKVEEEKLLRLRRLFDEKYSVSTPRELMRT
jgi:SpoVK/Ycf46/Vps4 family AAA+-type ATPase